MRTLVYAATGAACGEVKAPGLDSNPSAVDAREGEPDGGVGDAAPDAAPEPCRVTYAVLNPPTGSAHDVYTSLIDGSGEVNVSTDSADDFGPRFARTGRLLYLTTRDAREVWTSGPRGEDARRVVASAQFAAWSRDGARLAIGRMDGLYVTSADGLVEAKVSDKAPAGPPEFSPDDRAVVFQAFDGDIYSVPVGGGPTVNLTQTPGVSEHGPTYSPDGGRIAFSRVSDTMKPDIWTMTASGGDAANLTAGSPKGDTSPLWGPDGWIYFSSEREGAYRVFRIPEGGGVAHRVTDNAGTGFRAGDDPVDVSRDGVLLFERDHERVGIVRTDGTGLRLLDAVPARAGNLSCGVAL